MADLQTMASKKLRSQSYLSSDNTSMIKVDLTQKQECRFGVFCHFDLAYSKLPSHVEISEDSLKEMHGKISNKIPSKLV
jgi:hypothetical protein